MSGDSRPAWPRGVYGSTALALLLGTASSLFFIGQGSSVDAVAHTVEYMVALQGWGLLIGVIVASSVLMGLAALTGPGSGHG